MQFRSRILIVEDEEILAENLRDFLLRRVADVCTASSAESALDVARDFRPDYVVLDYSLPGINGLEAFSRLKGERPGLRGALISGHPTDQLRDIASDVGIDHVLTKPFSLAELDRVLLAWHSDNPTGQDHGADAADRSRPSKDRRSNVGVTNFPIRTPEGWVLQDRRNGDRRAPNGHTTEFAAAALAPR